MLYIPPLWFHNVTSIGFSVALNIFWRGHGGGGGGGGRARSPGPPQPLQTHGGAGQMTVCVAEPGAQRGPTEQRSAATTVRGGGGGGGTAALYASKDLYGNADLPSATTALEAVRLAAQQLSALPEPFRSFYTQRAVRELTDSASAGGGAGAEGGGGTGTGAQEASH